MLIRINTIMGVKHEDGINHSQEKYVSYRLAQTQCVCSNISG